MKTTIDILSHDILSEMETLQIHGGAMGNPDSPDDINYYCSGANCTKCLCYDPIKGGGATCDIHVHCGTGTNCDPVK